MTIHDYFCPANRPDLWIWKSLQTLNNCQVRSLQKVCKLHVRLKLFGFINANNQEANCWKSLQITRTFEVVRVYQCK